MNKNKQKQITETILNRNLNEQVHALIREFSMACKKAAIYGASHPSSQKAIQKPFLLLDEIFRFKKYINFNLHNGYLYLLNIRLKDSVFNEEIMKFMQILDVKVFTLEKHLTLGEFEKFVFRFVLRIDSTNHDELLTSYLKSEKIDSVEVNTEHAYKLFEEKNQYRGDVSHDFSVRNIIMQQLPDSIEALARLYSADEQFALKNYCDFDLEILHRLIPEKVAQLTSASINAEIKNHITGLVENHKEGQKVNAVSICKEICKLLEYHPEYDSITKNIDSFISCEDMASEFMSDFKSPSVRMKKEAEKNIDSLMSETFTDISIEFSPTEFVESFIRLLKTGQKEKASEISVQLVEYLGDMSYDFRQKALSLLIEIIKPLHLFSEKLLFEKLSQVIIRNLFEKKETFEYSEFIWQVVEKAINEKDYELLAKVMQSLYLRRRIENNVTIYDSIAIKKIHMNFNQKPIIDGLIDELLKGNTTTNQYLKEVLIGSGSEEVAVALAQIISHPNRQIRQLALRILGELGHASLDVFGNVLSDDKMFVRAEGRRELPDEKWYIIRNAIFVFGLLKDQKACIALRLRINDQDVRVRREIISALEKIGGEESIDVLMMMADDDDREIREAAVIAIGIIGTEDAAPLLISLSKQLPRVVIKTIHSLGQVGGKEAEKYLGQILNDADLVDELRSSKVSKEEIRLATVKALGSLGESGAIRTIKEYHDTQSTTQKIFFKNSPINKTIKKILSKK